jgi:hypothetical protein
MARPVLRIWILAIISAWSRVPAIWDRSVMSIRFRLAIQVTNTPVRGRVFIMPVISVVSRIRMVAAVSGPLRLQRRTVRVILLARRIFPTWSRLRRALGRTRVLRVRPRRLLIFAWVTVLTKASALRCQVRLLTSIAMRIQGFACRQTLIRLPVRLRFALPICLCV